MHDDLKHVSLATTFEIDDSFDSDRFIKLRLRVQHDGENPNGSAFAIEDIGKAQESIKNIPILAHVLFDDDGNPQFGSHDMHIEESKTTEGEYKLIYDEQPLGCVPETNNYTIAEYKGKNYVFVDSFVWRDYSNYGEEIIKRDTNIKLSMEIIVDAYKYDSKTKLYHITDYRYKGITLLGNNYGTGMLEALATTESFSETGKQRLFTLMSELKQEIEKNFSGSLFKISSYWADIDQANKLVEKTNKVFSQLGFECIEWIVDGKEYEVTGIINKTLNVEASDNWGFDIYDKDTITIKTCDLDKIDTASIYLSSVELLMKSKNNTVQNFSLRLKEDDSSFNINKSFSNEKEENKNLNEKIELIEKYGLTVEQLNFSIDEISLEDLDVKLKEFTENQNNDNNNDTKELSFSATYRQKREALNNVLDSEITRDDDGNLVDEIYYWIEDFNDTYVYVQRSHWSANGDYESNYGRFSYSFDEENLTATLTSEFEEMFIMWLTKEEKDALEAERGDYAQLKSDFEVYKEKYPEDEFKSLRKFQTETIEAERTEAETEIFSEFDKKLSGNEEYETLKTNSKEYDLDELQEKCFTILGKTQINFSFNAKKQNTIKINIDSTPTSSDPYGGLIEKVVQKQN